MERQVSSGHGRDVTVTVNRLDSRLRMPRCAKPLTTFLPPGGRTIGSVSVGVRCNADHPWSLYVPVSVAVRDKVVVLRHAMARGDTIKASDVEMEQRNLSRLAFGYITSPKAAIDQRLLRPAQANTVLNPSMLQAPLMVHRGQTVTLIAGESAVSVRMSGQALSDGSLGDVVHVRNSHSRRVIAGVVTGKGEVRVGLGG